jgi:hypothetical protein
MNEKNKAALAALTASSLALTSIAVEADSAPADSAFSYRMSFYDEENAPGAKISSGDASRYSIRAHQFHLLTPIKDEYSLALDFQQESMSGASPWGTTPDADNQPQLIMSGASIEESRTDATAAGRYYADNGNYGGFIGSSNEKDYQSVYLGLNGERHYNQNNTSVKIGLSTSDDKLNPTDAAKFGRIANATKTSQSINASVAQILSPVTLANIGFSYTSLSGHLSDPYKIDDARPGSRGQMAISSQLRHYVKKSNAALHFGYRYFVDDWDVNSHTFDLAWHQNIIDSFDNALRIIPSIRYYIQTEASFYEPYKSSGSDPKYFSSDYRLSPYGAISGKLKIVYSIKRYTYSVSLEKYQSSSDYSVQNVVIESPGLVNFTRITMGFDLRF